MARPSCETRVDALKQDSHFRHFPAVLRIAFDQVTCCNYLLPDHYLGCSHIAVSRAPISQISARVIEIHRLKSFSDDYQ